MNNPFEKLGDKRRERKQKEQKKRLDRSADITKKRDKRRLLTLNHAPMVTKVLVQLRDAIYPGLSLGEDPWECKWYLYRPMNNERDKEIVLSVSLKLDANYEPQCFQCERLTGKFDSHGGPRLSRDTDTLKRKDLIKVLNKLHPSGTL